MLAATWKTKLSMVSSSGLNRFLTEENTSSAMAPCTSRYHSCLEIVANLSPLLTGLNSQLCRLDLSNRKQKAGNIGSRSP
jgi:hypothetical protein